MQLNRRAMTVALLAIALAGCSTAAPAAHDAALVTSPGAPETTVAPVVPEPATAAFKDIALKGKGHKVAKFTIPEDAAAIAVLTHKGKSNFIVHSVGADGEMLDGLVNEIGNYSGTVLFDTEADEHAVAFEIDADGAWTITVKPVTSATVWDPTSTLKGKGDAVYEVSPASSGLVTLDLTFKGEANFIIHAYTLDGSEGLANEIGPFSGQVLLPDGTFLLEVVANGGTWSATPG
jgi:hypothetical protein